MPQAKPQPKVKCPKCGSFDVLVGTDDEPHHCSDCQHEWEKKSGPITEPTACENKVLAFKSPQVLLTINQNFARKNKQNLFEIRLSKNLSLVVENQVM